MSNLSKKEYLIEIRKRYFLATRAEKSLILDELCAICSFNRKYAIRVISKDLTEHIKKKGRPKKYYSKAIRAPLKTTFLSCCLAQNYN